MILTPLGKTFARQLGDLQRFNHVHYNIYDMIDNQTDRIVYDLVWLRIRNPIWDGLLDILYPE